MARVNDIATGVALAGSGIALLLAWRAGSTAAAAGARVDLEGTLQELGSQARVRATDVAGLQEALVRDLESVHNALAKVRERLDSVERTLKDHESPRPQRQFDREIHAKYWDLRDRLDKIAPMEPLVFDVRSEDEK